MLMFSSFKSGYLGRQRFFMGLVLVVLVALFRVPWLGCDSGISSFWGYGYFVTDEGYYSGDGRLAYLTGSFFSPNGESLSFVQMPLVNILVFVSYKIFGLHLWAMRVPQLIASLWTWWLVYYMGAKRTTPWLSALLVLLISSSPPCLAYERTMSTDFVMGAFAITSFWFLLKKGRYFGFFAAVCLLGACATKMSALGWVPLLILASLKNKKNRWIRTSTFLFTFVILFFGFKNQMNTYVERKAKESGVSVERALALGDRVTKPPKLSIKRIPAIMRAVSSAPRWPVAGKISFYVVWIMGASGLVAIRKMICSPLTAWRRFEILSVGILVYTLLVSTHVFFNVRYLLSAFCLTPLLIIEMRKSAFAMYRSAFWRRLLLTASLLILGLWVYRFAPLSSVDQSTIMYSQFMLPKAVLWSFTWPGLILFAATGTLLVLVFVKQSRRWLFGVAVFLIFLWLAHISTTASPYLRGDIQLSPEFKSVFLTSGVLIVIQMIGLCVGILLLGSELRRCRVWYGVVLLLFVSTYLINPTWKASANELSERRNYVSEKAREIAKQLPNNSVIIGDRAISMFGESRFELIPHATPNAQIFWAQIENRLRKEPERPVLLLLDPVQSQSWQELERLKKTLGYRVIAKIRLPSFSSGEMMDTYIAQLGLVDRQREL